jgi:hypothetical protein
MIMNEQTDPNEITLRCKPLDSIDPTMLRCEIIPKPVLQENRSELDASKTPLPDQSGSVTATSSSDVSEDAVSQAYTTITLRKVQRDGKEVYEPVKDSQSLEKNAKPSKEARPNLTQSSGCDRKHCVITRDAQTRRNKPASRK